MYFKNINGKFSLKSMGLKYYFKEFKELADSMKVYKYDEIHKFSIANSLIPILYLRQSLHSTMCYLNLMPKPLFFDLY